MKMPCAACRCLEINGAVSTACRCFRLEMNGAVFFSVACHGPAHIIAWHASSDKHSIHAEWSDMLCTRSDRITHSALFPPISTKPSVLVRPIFGSLPAPSWAPSPACSTLAPVDQPFDEVLWWCALIVAGPKTTGTTPPRIGSAKHQLQQGFFKSTGMWLIVTSLAAPAAEI